MGEIVYEIGPGHGDPGYETVALWQTATQIDIVASGVTSGEAVILIGELMVAQSGYDEDGLAFAGATTDANNYRILRSKSDAVHTGRRNTGAVVYSDVGSFGATININEHYFRFHGVEVQSDGDVIQYGVYVNPAASGVEVSGAIVYEHAYGGVAFLGSGICVNTVVHHVAGSESDSLFGAFQGTAGSESQAVMMHCVALASTADSNKSTTGFRYVTAHNCISVHYGGSAGHKDFLNLGAGSQNNCSTDDSADDWTSPGLPDQVATDLFQNVTSGVSTDLHIKSTAGVASSGSGLSTLVPTDIDGEAFNVSTPSIGADQFSAVSPVTQLPVYRNDPNLVMLYRFDNGPYTSGSYPVPNKTLAEAYVEQNTLVASGRFEGMVDVAGQEGPPNAPLSSGQWFGSGLFNNGFEEGDHFHLAAGSGNMSGLQVQSGESLSVGTWVKVSGWDESDEITLIDRSFDTTQEYWFHLAKQFDNIGKTQVYAFEFGTESGVDFEWVASNPYRTSGVWEHVVGVVDSDAATAKIYVNGVDVTSGVSPDEKIYAPPGPLSAQGIVAPFKIGAQTYDVDDVWVTGNLGYLSSGWLAESFVMNRAMADAEVSGVFSSGFSEPIIDRDSDTKDVLKDNVGIITSTASTIIMTAWDPTDLANPSGVRHATSGFHPAFVQVLGLGATSGMPFGDLLQTTVSGTKAVTFRNASTGTQISNMRFWMQDFAALGSSGWNMAVHVDSEWLNLTLPSGSGILGKTLGSAISVLRSDLETTISGYSLDGTVQSGEEEISQYIYLAFNADTEFQPGTYGPDGFGFRLTVDNV